MSRACQYCQNHVQRLRISVQATDVSGSRGLAPGELRHLLCPICSNSRRDFVSPVDWDWQVLPVRLCESEPCQIAIMKSGGNKQSGEIPEKIAAFLSKEATARFRVSRCWASSHHFFGHASRLGARTGTFPPFYSQPP